MPYLRQAFTPSPVVNITGEEFRAYVDGDDPVAKRPFMDVIIDALTQSVAESETGSFVPARPLPKTIDVDEDLVYETFLKKGWTDQLPIIAPTRERVDAMLAGTSHAPDEIVRPTGMIMKRGKKADVKGVWTYTVEQVAVNAVMAGARPEYLPVILALAASGRSARAHSTQSMGSMGIVNGPIRHELDMNCGLGAMGPFNHANSTIGRAWGLLSQNVVGGIVPGVSYMGSQGNPVMYGSPVFGENEERSPWEPFHVEHGFKAEESTISVFGGNVSTEWMNGVRRERWREQIAKMLAGMAYHDSPLFILDPIPAHEFVEREAEFSDKSKLLDWFHENALMEARDFWNNREAEVHRYAPAVAGIEPWATNLRALEENPEALVKKFDRTQMKVIVVGGESAGTWRVNGTRFEGTHSIDAWR